MKDTLREDIRKIVGTKRDNSNYVFLAYKNLTFNISNKERSYDVVLEGECESVDHSGQTVVNPEQYAGYLDQGRVSDLHHDKVALFHVRESGKTHSTEVFDSLADVFQWVGN